MRILVTGRAGSGKTAVSRELRKRGYNAYDTDTVPGLSAWIDKDGKKQIFEDNSYVDLESYDWLWDEEVLCATLDTHDNIFICGGAHNDLSFDHLFDAYFVLDVAPNTQIQRITSRTDNDYAKDPRMHQRVLENQHQHLIKAVKQNHIVIDANQPITDVVDQILRQL